MRWITENRQYQFRITGSREVISRRGRVAMPVARAFEKVPINFLDEKFGQAANEEPRVRLLERWEIQKPGLPDNR